MKIKIIAVGTTKDAFLKMGCDEYIKRIKPYSNIEIIEVKDEKMSDHPSEAEILKAKVLEGQRISKQIKQADYVINLDLNQKEFDSVSFASFLDKTFEKGNSQITFIIGGSYGLSDDIKNRANDAISLSKLTFLHTMTRLILLEQIYRAFKINNNETYHK